jgi:3-phosphoshikimate 1-carboxyvinyltransferase
MSKHAYIYPLAHPIHAKVKVPGSKSFTNRALVIAALANGTSVLHGASNANDSAVLIRLLQQLGVEIESNGDSITVKGNGGKFGAFNGELNVEDAGTVMRFLSAFSCLVPGEITLKGSDRMHERPIHGLVNA